MRRNFFQPITPKGLVIDGISHEADRMLIAAHQSAEVSACPPDCGFSSTRVHSRYVRRLADLPVLGHAVHLRVQVRRFRCDNTTCPRQIFGEPLAETVASRAAGRTSRLESIVHHLGFSWAADLQPVLPVD